MINRRFKRFSIIAGMFVLTIAAAYILGHFAAEAVMKLRAGETESTRGERPTLELHDDIVVGNRLPNATLLNLYGKPVELESLVSGNGVVAYISPDCPHCQAQIELIQSLATLPEDCRKFVLVSNSDRDSLLFMQSTMGIDFPVLHDEGMRYNKDHLGVPAVPFNFIVDDSMYIREIVSGRLDSATILEVIESGKTI